MKRIHWIRLVTVAVPIASLLMAVLAIAFERHHLLDLQDQLTSSKNEIASAKTLIGQLQATTAYQRLAAAQVTSEEQPAFLNDLRTWAAAHDVKIVRWTNMRIDPNTHPGASSGGGGTATGVAPYPTGVFAYPSTIDVAGSYTGCRAFMYDALRAQRIYSLNNVKWSRGQKNGLTDVNFTLTRYLSTAPLMKYPPKLDTAPAAGAPAASPAGGTVTQQKGATIPLRTASAGAVTPATTAGYRSAGR